MENLMVVWAFILIIYCSLFLLMKNYNNLVYFLISYEMLNLCLIFYMMKISVSCLFLFFMYMIIQVSDSVFIMVMYLKNHFLWNNINMWVLSN